MSKHTPGPWDCEWQEVRATGIQGNPVICFMQDWVDEFHEEREANARLIAAAPDLLEALNRINEWCCFATEEDISARLMALQQIGQAAREAIEKASQP